MQTWLASKADGRFRLKLALAKLQQQYAYDYVLIDTQGAKGNLQDAAVLAADILLSLILPELATVKELERETLSMLAELQSYKSMGISVAKLFGVIYKVDRTKDAKSFVAYLINSSKTKPYTILNTQIPQATAFKEATSQQVPVTEFINSNNKQQLKAQKSAMSIIDLVNEIQALEI